MPAEIDGTGDVALLINTGIDADFHNFDVASVKVARKPFRGNQEIRSEKTAYNEKLGDEKPETWFHAKKHYVY